MQSLAQRIQEVIDKTGMSQADIARAAGVTDAAVGFWLTGATHSLKGVTAAKLETKTGFRAAWLASGKGPKLAAPSEGGDMLLPKEVELIQALRLLTDAEQEAHFRAIVEAARHNQAVVAQHLKRQGLGGPTPAPAPKRMPR